MRSDKQLCRVEIPGFTLFVGNYDTCNRWTPPDGSRTLHIWHPGQKGACNKCHGPDGMEYREGDLLTESQIERVRQFASSRILFVHCAAGLGRSPTLGVLASAFRGVHPAEAMALIGHAMWKQYCHKHPPVFEPRVIQQIVGITSHRHDS